jgi:hypothetical protein
MVGFRVFDVGLLIVWLVWFFRLRDDESDSPGEGGDGGGGSPRPKQPRTGPGGGGLRLPGGRWQTGRGPRPRSGHRPARTPLHRRPTPPLPTPLPARVRSPRSPVRVTRRS